MTFHVPEKWRIHGGPQGSNASDGNNGVFLVRLSNKVKILVIASDGFGWEHASASFRGRTPSWDEMCELKDIFWDPEDWVVQFHPARSEYVNQHPHCLHLWRPVGAKIPIPDSILVGYKDLVLV
jgi:hypothetical protein